MFYDKLKTVCADRKTTVTTMLKQLNVSTAHTGSWKKGGIPSVGLLKRIAEHLEVTTDFLLDMADDPAPPSSKKADEGEITFDDFGVALYGEVSELDDEDRAELLKSARRMNELRKLKKTSKTNEEVNPNG